MNAKLALVFLVAGLVCCFASQETKVETEKKDTKPLLSSNGCSCDEEKDDCGCCAHLKLERLGIDDNACVNVTYLPDDYGIAVAFMWNDKIIFNKTISAKNPPPICAGIPYVKLAESCVRLYNISYDKDHFGGCIALEIELVGLKEDFPLGCFYKSHAQLRQHYKKFQQNVKEVKKNLRDIKENTQQTVKDWDYMKDSENLYHDVKTKVVKEIGSFRKFLSNALVEFGEMMKPHDKDEKGEKTEIFEWLGKKIERFQG